MLTLPVRTLGEGDRAAVERVLDRDPIAAAQVAERVRARGLGRWSTLGTLLGYGAGRQLDAVCWVGTGLIPVQATPVSVAAFAELLGNRPHDCSSILGPADAVLGLWQRLGERWGPAREIRAAQPLLVADAPPAVRADPGVRRVRPDELDVLYPAAVAMYTEEVGISPTAEDGGRCYRHRVAELVRHRRAYARIVAGRVVFKAEVAVVTRHTAQVQGVWVAPQWRGQGVATAGLATVVRDVLRTVAPSVSLYVNDYNHAARRVYARCGFREVGTFATVLF
ncbi:MAG TPA: GNAT family N-acetyltransferase [Micromonosporaceae bacterium]|nr:GNAT family N-acetyltransferase [Micromonosporaceae bacterium]